MRIWIDKLERTAIRSESIRFVQKKVRAILWVLEKKKVVRLPYETMALSSLQSKSAILFSLSLHQPKINVEKKILFACSQAQKHSRTIMMMKTDEFCLEHNHFESSAIRAVGEREKKMTIINSKRIEWIHCGANENHNDSMIILKIDCHHRRLHEVYLNSPPPSPPPSPPSPPPSVLLSSQWFSDRREKGQKIIIQCCVIVFFSISVFGFDLAWFIFTKNKQRRRMRRRVGGGNETIEKFCQLATLFLKFFFISSQFIDWNFRKIWFRIYCFFFSLIYQFFFLDGKLNLD